MNTDVNLPILNSVTTDVGTQQIGAAPQNSAVKQVTQASGVVETDRTKEQESEKAISNEELESVVTEMNTVAQDLQRDLLFSVDEKNGGTFVKVIDKETDEIVREIPSKEIREIKSRLEEVAGLIFRKSV